MSKRRPASPNPQLGFAFGEPERFARDGALAGLGKRTAAIVGEMLKADPRSRYEVAADVSRLLDEDVSKAMLDAYASPARDAHRISFDRMFALTASCGGYDLLRRPAREIGIGLVVGPEAVDLMVGQLRARQRRTAEELRRYESWAADFDRERGGR